MIQFSPSALRELRRLQSRNPQGNSLVRLAIQPGGCDGLRYDLYLDPSSPPGSAQVLTLEGVKIVVDQETLTHCQGMAVDYSEDLMGGNFRFTNPLARHTCSCGISFSHEELPATPSGEGPDCATISQGS